MTNGHATTLVTAMALGLCAAVATGCGGGGEHHNGAHHPDPNAGSGQANRPVDGARGEARDDAHDRHVEATTNWEKLGERNVDGKIDHDTIPVGRADGKFSAIQIKVEHSALEMFDVVVHFGDGTSFSPPTKLVFKNGESTRVIDLPGGKRVITKVDFKYGNLPGGGRAQVELWGK